MRAAARGVVTLDDDPEAAIVTNTAHDILLSLRLGLTKGEDVPYHWHKYVIAYDIGLREREVDRVKREEGGYTQGGPVATPKRANEIVQRLREMEQGASEE